jgi:hypothetical protein
LACLHLAPELLVSHRSVADVSVTLFTFSL